MKGVDHYKQAEEHLSKAEQSRDVPVVCSFHLKIADLHAQLALVAATASARLTHHIEFFEAWREVV